MENILQKAIEIATESHKNQTDRAGKPYIGHITRVMQAGKTIEERIAGILHDIVEDTHWTFEDLLREGIPAEVVDAIRCLTKIEDETYDQFIERVKTNPIAVAVKLNDLRDNMDITRLPAIADKDIERLCKYHKAYSELSNLKVANIPTV
ncbi:MAG: phosphohydrolase [Bacteroidaceae bacterium]|nr:phosphohydrolase [Bacteroidaceae bacterium]